ncbi:predicted protein [Sclerotinia sclerotiorum 1980 UF-70]|uniref:Uncharacterized protein n=1 Tax=Sclerotinia sclerotiorum (strain ATCC 18683 / 1980 / Ss-1) TaxID=665079 RepID=A7F0Y3_SCLS1|nr:predicted protein [Sclerotinia sclerotiorum 1980 UF-70]EDN95375.1 predicted protein [Sclerotinia sclerotiorum 1980 UF-70]
MGGSPEFQGESGENSWGKNRQYNKQTNTKLIEGRLIASWMLVLFNLFRVEFKTRRTALGGGFQGQVFHALLYSTRYLRIRLKRVVRLRGQNLIVASVSGLGFLKEWPVCKTPAETLPIDNCGVRNELSLILETRIDLEIEKLGLIL